MFDCLGAAGILSEAERRRADRYRFDEDRARYIAGRATLKRVLAERIGMRAEDLIVAEAEWTKPRLALPAGRPPVYFNVSHSGDYALVAVTDAAEVGIDIEQIRADCPIDELARRYYSAHEYEMLCQLPASRRLHDFYRLWTTKEAVLKCAGLGLSVPPAVVEVRLSTGAVPQIHCLDAKREFLEQISVRELVVADGYVSAIAVESQAEIELNVFSYRNSPNLY